MAEKDGRRYGYSPVLQRDDWVNSQSGSLLDRLFHWARGAAGAVLQRAGQVELEDIAELKRLIERLDDGQ